jgi:hypothetical protein
MLALKLRAPQPAEEVLCDEYWIGDVELCGSDWAFSVIGPDEEIETFVYSSQLAAESARIGAFRTLCPALSIATNLA